MIAVGTWADGLFVCIGSEQSHELQGQSVIGLSPDGQGGLLAIVGKQELRRRSADGLWSTLATFDAALSCCMATPHGVFVGTDDARLLRLDGDRLEAVAAFDRVEGRDTWFAGTAVVDGRVVGPPLGIRSMDASPDGGQVFVNVHVGGIPYSTDGGATWRPSIDVMTDVHQVRVHPERPNIVAAAAAVGLCMSYDGGAHWQTITEGLHESYCSALTFVGNDVLVAAAEHHFSPRGAVYRMPIAEGATPTKVQASDSGWLHGIADTYCLVAQGQCVAAVDGEAALRVSNDAGETWSVRAAKLPPASSCLIL